MRRDVWSSIVDYHSVLEKIADQPIEAQITFLQEMLPYVCRDAYAQMAPRQMNIVRFQFNTFEYIYDDYASLEVSGAVPYNQNIEARLVLVIGRSNPQKRIRDDQRLRGWIGPTEKLCGGKGWDKGHYIAHSIGGAVESVEVNVFVQRRDLNRGWSVAGKRFRRMEKYCQMNPRTFCFSRPIYADQSAKPVLVEFGLMKSDGELWVERFENQ